MHYLQKPLEIFSKIATEQNVGYHKALENLSKEEYEQLRTYIKNIKSRSHDIFEALNDVEVDRNTDYRALIKNSHKRFNDGEIAILEFLTSNDYGYHINYIADQIGEDYASTRKKLRRLRRLGLTDNFSGGWTEDGEMFGSGYMCNERHLDEAKAIVKNYLAAVNQQTLLKD